MLRVIFDTNIYGRLMTEKDFSDIEEKIINQKEFIVYGYKLIRKELRDIPKITKSSKDARNKLLALYDKMTGNHILEHSAKVVKLAQEFYKYYRKAGGIYGWDTNIDVDFMIVAVASLNGLDIVYSGDKKTLMSNAAIEAYKAVASKENLRPPMLFNYELILKKFRGLL